MPRYYDEQELDRFARELTPARKCRTCGERLAPQTAHLVCGFCFNVKAKS